MLVLKLITLKIRTVIFQLITQPVVAIPYPEDGHKWMTHACVITGEGNPVQAWTGHESSRRMRLPDHHNHN